QMAIASGFNKVFEIGPVFRAENSHTSYHATEILMIDVEIANVSEITEVMKEEERWIKYFMNKLVDKYSEEIKEILNISLKPIDYTFPQIDFYEVKKILKNKYNSGLDDLDRQEEKLIGDYVLDKYNSDFVFITNYPYSARSFYVMQDDGTTKSYDLLYKGIEITSGAIREHRYETLKEQIMAKGYNVNNFLFYLDFFKYGVPPHGGFGVGMNRLLMRLFEIDNIREATFIYRGPTRLEP
ncbi:MAG: amino acid--tRNA ligase-related protein, partial [Bacilli bacterium]